MLRQYLKRILKVARLGDAREESFYSALETLLNEFAVSEKKKGVHVTSQPTRTDAGNPDFRVWDERRIVGYIEAKTPDRNLDDIEKTEQVKRYKTTFPNFILTNFVEFRLYRNGSLVDEVKIADPTIIHSLKGVPPAKNELGFANLLKKFFSFSFPSITSAQPLAVELAKRTRFLRDEVIAEELREEERKGIGRILGFYEAFQTYLIRGLTKEQFADLYSQTITYGLFASRMRCKGDFNRKHAVDDIPRSIGILKEMFEYISLGDLPTQLEWIVDEISDVLANVDVKRIFSEFFRSKKGKDPVYHFYETFLEKYDPKERERRGVYYTPEPVVSYIVRSLHLLLKEKFGLEDGLASENLTILDPAAGTLTFIAEAMKHAVREFASKYGEGGKEEFLMEHILKHFYAFELMIAPYAIGHLKITFLLEELGHKLQNDERFRFYLTNSLEMEDIEQTSLPSMASLDEESRKAGEVKKGIPIFVILGNPPYSGISANMGEWITGLIENYKYVDGKHFGERKHWLQDDYVKFIRFAEWKINQVGKGVIGYITNHSYLDNPTFRGMRQHLMKSFDEIFVLDLHGNSLKKEKCPDGSKDENVFDIRQGVAITFLVKKKINQTNECKVFHSERWGLREKKYEWLLLNGVNTTEWEEIYPHSPFYFFIPREEKYEELYAKHWKVTDIFPINSVGIVTSRDNFVTGFDKNALMNRIRMFRNLSISDETIRKEFKLRDTSTFKLRKSREMLSQDKDWEKHLTKVLYRPFDVRYIYYASAVVERPLYNTMRHMMQSNVGLLAMRQVSLDEDYTHFLVSEYIVDNRAFLSSKGIVQLFPLYQYENSERTPNIQLTLIKKLKENYHKKVEAVEILHYMYAIFYSNTYRTKYTEFLNIDFPRVPLTANYVLLIKMAKLGKKLIDLHLLKSELLGAPTAKFQGKGDNIVEKPAYDEEDSRVYINKTQCFEGVEKDVWEYQIGGYQVLSKWLNYRKKRKLSLTDIKHYCRVVTALKRTIDIQDEIDKLYPDIEKDIIEFKENRQNASLEKYAQ